MNAGRGAPPVADDRWTARRARRARDLPRYAKHDVEYVNIRRSGCLSFMFQTARDRGSRSTRSGSRVARDRRDEVRARARSIERARRAISRARARARAIPAHSFYNVCPPRFLLRRPRRRLQGDQDPSAYFLALARRAATRGTRSRARDAIASRGIDRRREIRDIARATCVASSRRLASRRREGRRGMR